MVVLASLAAPHQAVLELLVSFSVLLVCARGLGALAVRLGQSSVVGELLAGLLLGSSLLGRLWPSVTSWFTPQSDAGGWLLGLVGLLGAIFLLMLTGLETDFDLIRRNARVAAGVAVGGLVLPFVLGYFAAYLVPESMVANPGRPTVFALFFATGLAVSAIPVIAKILLDLGLIRRRFGQTVLAAGMIDDTVAWILLSVVVALANEESTSPWTLVLAAAKVLVFMGLALTVGRWIVDRALGFIQDRGTTPDGVLTLAVAVALAFGAVAMAFGIEAVMGALLAGLVLGLNPRLPVEVVGRLHTMALAVFAPVFFAIAGLQVDVAILGDMATLRIAIVTLIVAIAGKCFGAALVARLMGVDVWTSLAYGAALNARGAIGIIVASIGLNLGILSNEIYAIIVLTSVVTSMLAPPMVRAFLRRVAPDDEEDRRLARESSGPIGGQPPRRILVPVRTRPGVAPVHEVVSELVRSISSAAQVTLLTVVPDTDAQPMADKLLETLAPRFGHSQCVVEVGDDPTAEILRVARTGFDLVVLGAPEIAADEGLFDPVVDTVTRLAPCPVLIVAGHGVDRVSWPPRRIMVPVDGTETSRGAARLALTLAGDAELNVVHVVPRSNYPRSGVPARLAERRVALGREVVADIKRVGESYSATVTGDVVMGSGDFVDDILRAMSRQDIDLLVMGSSLRPGSARLHLGPRVEEILQLANCPVLLVNTN
jgi:Kef-type K+ transport system membrane component KefB